MLTELIEFLTDRIAVQGLETLQHGEGPECVVVPTGYELKQLPGFIPPKPDHINRLQKFDTPAAMVIYLNRFNPAGELVISDVKARTVHATIDFHKHELNPDRCEHRAQWTMVIDEAFQPWFTAHNTKITHEDFVAFLDTYGDCIVSPTNAELIKLVEQIEIISSSAKVSLVSKQGDRALLKVVDDQKVQGKDEFNVTIDPVREFKILVPVQQDGKAKEITINVNYSTKSGVLGIRPMVHNLPKLLRDEFRLGEAVIAASGRVLLSGSIQ